MDTLCREHGRGGLERCEHEHLSGWKERGTYRLMLQTEEGPTWRLIFKDECYSPELIPALEGLSVVPGPPEVVIYRDQNKVLSQFLPRLFWFREVERGRHFQYLLQDLGETHVLLPPSISDYIEATRGLVQMHKSLKQAFDSNHADGLVRYDRLYSERLLEYAARNLADYVIQTSDQAVAALLDRWSDVVMMHQRDEFYEDGLRVPIHGDYNQSNIHIRRGSGGDLKVVDWEWAGIGVPHADLAALVKSIPAKDHPALLRTFVQESRQLDPEHHWRLFQWCYLERRLLDGGFLARQQLSSGRRGPWLQREVRRSAGDVLAAVAQLSAGEARAMRRL